MIGEWSLNFVTFGKTKWRTNADGLRLIKESWLITVAEIADYNEQTTKRNCDHWATTIADTKLIVLSVSLVFRATALSKAAVLDRRLCLSFNSELGFLLDQFRKKLLCKMMKDRAILIESCVDDQELV
jgi:hypothetical protein